MIIYSYSNHRITSHRHPQGVGEVTWNEEVVFPTVPVTADLRISIFQRSVIGSDTFLGEVVVPARDVAEGRTGDGGGAGGGVGGNAAGNAAGGAATRLYTLARRTTRQAVSGHLELAMHWRVTELGEVTLRNVILEQRLDQLLEDLAKLQEDDAVGRGRGRDLLRKPEWARAGVGVGVAVSAGSAVSGGGGVGGVEVDNAAISATGSSRSVGGPGAVREVVRRRLGLPPKWRGARGGGGGGGEGDSVAWGGAKGFGSGPGSSQAGAGDGAAGPVATRARLSRPGRLELTVLEARNLAGAGRSVLPSLDTFCVAALRSGMGGMGGQTHATGVVSNTASPVWSESLRFEPAQLGDTLEATVMRKRRGRSSKAIGSVSVPLANLADGMPRYAWLPLTARERGAGEGGGDGGVGRVMETGELHLRLRWRDDVAEEDSGTVVIEAVLGGVGLLVVDSGMLDMHTRTPRELVYTSLSAVELTLRRTPTKETLRVAVQVRGGCVGVFGDAESSSAVRTRDWGGLGLCLLFHHTYLSHNPRPFYTQSIQVDNQLLSSGHPVMLGRSAHAYALPRAAADVPGLSETSAGKPYRQIAEAEAAVPPMLEVRWDRQFTNPTIQFFKLFTVVIQASDGTTVYIHSNCCCCSVYYGHTDIEDFIYVSYKRLVSQIFCLSYYLHNYIITTQEMDLVVEEELIDAVVSMGARLPWDDLWQGRGGGKTTKGPGQELQVRDEGWVGGGREREM